MGWTNDEEKNLIIGFVKQMVMRKDFEMSKLQEILPQEELIKHITEDNRDSIISKVIECSKPLQVLISNLGIKWAKPNTTKAFDNMIHNTLQEMRE